MGSFWRIHSLLWAGLLQTPGLSRNGDPVLLLCGSASPFPSVVLSPSPSHRPLPRTTSSPSAAPGIPPPRNSHSPEAKLQASCYSLASSVALTPHHVFHKGLGNAGPPLYPSPVPGSRSSKPLQTHPAPVPTTTASEPCCCKLKSRPGPHSQSPAHPPAWGAQ
ncbi:hypothetical protein H1C71_040569, partial [Ictidomys tridecemlineatus]